MILDEILENLKSKGQDKAYTVNNHSYSYEELYKFVCNIYYFLLLENKEKKPIIVYGHKEVYMKATFLACSFAGITYVPIDESLPKERVDLIINQVNPYCIIGDFESDCCKNISKQKICELMENEKFNEISQIYLNINDIYYIIFTSGSTGVPKGVKVTYKNLDSCIKWLKEIVKANNEIILNQANFSFDLSVADLYLSVVSGSEHFILENNGRYNFTDIFVQLKQSKATIAVMTPSFADLLLLDKSFRDEILPNLKTIIFCGERLLKATIEKLYLRFKNLKIINSYGPTECTFAVTSIEITDEILKQQDIPVGKPKKDVEIIIIDKNRKKLADDQVGEILIIGESVASGYLGEIKENSFIEYNGKNAYLTGDLGYLKNGNLYYKCRMDNQIKYKGYRIELSDIEENLYNLNYFDKVKVIEKKSEENKIIKLIAFVKLKTNIDKTDIEIKKELALKIPEYMRPVIKILEEFPINSNGKTDIEKLRRIVNGRESY